MVELGTTPMRCPLTSMYILWYIHTKYTKSNIKSSKFHEEIHYVYLIHNNIFKYKITKISLFFLSISHPGLKNAVFS